MITEAELSDSGDFWHLETTHQTRAAKPANCFRTNSDTGTA